jgi:hypothetical protein
MTWSFTVGSSQFCGATEEPIAERRDRAYRCAGTTGHLWFLTEGGHPVATREVAMCDTELVHPYCPSGRQMMTSAKRC